MADLQSNPWIRGNQNFPQTPLMTPDALGSIAERTVQATFNAFNQAQREGFRLQDVGKAKLAQRRRMKKSSSDNNSSSSSSFTSEGSLKGSKQKLSIDLKKTDEKPSSAPTISNKDNNVFSFGENRVSEFLQTMSPHPAHPDAVSPSNSVSVRTSDSVTSEVMRESTSSSGIVVSDKNSVDSKKEKKTRQKKLFIPSRQSERIKRIRLEIDGEPPVEFLSLPNRTRKRKIDEVIVEYSQDKPKSSPTKQSSTTPTSRRSRKKAKR